ncbi:hypothetical protein L226DRAFT_613093 [Lentinus tigrinus ALCF2SS1-7]|uniref:DUF6699 domain-containing protein n=1 Tax=Lentinus tigrinus ALCF2SS1-6 TaxID=1328759 RepID=A0A5C2SAG7_9APHY|nr:hypothetical protein L227DRAFT_575664 [Lentinus tigrinus ALCF2SS1-6]RPD74846.1 hypothetical protein L226DRAFT_613093 [Lentinus tigrinus ALCF2SS1-7]
MSLHARPHHVSVHGTKYHAQYTITYYRLRPVTHDALKQQPPSLPPDPYTRIHVPPQSGKTPPEQPHARPPPRRHSDVHEERLKAKHRRVRWADEDTIINPKTPPPPETSPAASTPQPKPSVLVKSRRSSASAPPATPHKTARTLPVLHDLLVSFPPGLWDMRRRASPTFYPSCEPRYWEPVFPSSLSTKSMRLVFTPCPRTELSWFATVAPSGTHLVIEDVLRAISTELFQRSACSELYTDHPCYAKANAARQLRTRSGWSDRAYYEDGIRNVDLYHVERGFALWFRGLTPERLRSGEVVYRVRFSYA